MKNWLRGFGFGAAAGVGEVFTRRFPWLVATAGLIVFLAFNWVWVALAGFAVWLRTEVGSWTRVAVLLLVLWTLWQVAKAGVAVRRGSARTAKQILIGLSRVWKVRRGYDQAAARTGVLSARNDAQTVARASNWRPTERGILLFVAYGAMGRTPEDMALFCQRFPRQFNAARARTIEVPGLLIGCDVLLEWGNHLARIWTSAAVWALVRSSGIPRNMIPLGINQDGWPDLTPANLSILIGGLTGVGKSVLIWNWLLGCLMQGYRVRLWVIDPKGGVEFSFLEKHLGRTESPLYVHRYCDDMEYLDSDQAYRTGGFWAEFKAAQESKQRIVKARGTRSLTVEDVTTGGEYLDVLIVDEYLTVAGLDQFKQRKLNHPAAMAVYTGRVTWTTVLACVQEGQKTAVGDIRDLFPVRYVGATPNDYVTDSVLGKAATRDGAAAHRLDIVHDQGVFYTAREGGQGYEQMRTAWIPDSEAKVIASGQLPNWGEAMVDPERPCSVYRYDFNRAVTWDGRDYFAGDVAYIGEAYDVASRHAQHVADPLEWWTKFCDLTVVETFHLPGLGMTPKQLARLAQDDLIYSDKPLFNHQRNLDNPNRVPKAKRKTVA